ncbi:MAG: hypothetical protein C0503_02890 [Gemmatimonas sp.]|nr:hypothetical protein [Gemmatimonas sp.]
MSQNVQTARQRFVKRGNTLKSQRLTLALEDGPLELELREVTAKRRTQLLKDCTTVNEDGDGGKVDQEKLVPAVLIACVYDAATGEPMFSEADRDLINGMSAAFIDEVFAPAAALSGLTKEAQEQLKGNSDATAAADSSSPSPAN